MRPALFLFLGSMIPPAISSSDGETWAVVPAARDGRARSAIVLPDTPSEGVVVLLGSDRASVAMESGRNRVYSVDLVDPPAGSVQTPPSPESAGPTVPAEAQWPDAHGRIVASHTALGGPSTAPGIRNPWDVRVPSGAAPKEVLFECGGIVSGGEGGRVAILNGRIVRRGDSLGEFGVAGVLASAVMLERKGSFFVIPKGRATTVAIAEH